jgi:hypothetical protein
MGFTLVWGGDHYVFDILLGWGVVAAVMVGLSRLERRPAAEAELEPVVVHA